MLSLTPLRFPRVIIDFNDPQQKDKSRYGAQNYQTSCGRFAFYKHQEWWRVLERYDQWFDWLKSVGIKDTAFSTRRVALKALDIALTADGLMDAKTVA